MSGGAQAVMAADTLLNSLADQGQLSGKDMQSLRPEMDRLYGEVRDPNAWRPDEFRQALAVLAASVRRYQ